MTERATVGVQPLYPPEKRVKASEETETARERERERGGKRREERHKEN